MAPGIAEKKNNSLPLWGNEKTMNLNNLILTNILSSHYFKVNLYQLKTYHEVIDEIYYQVSHLEPWEKGSRKTSGQTGMCGGVRGVGAGGIVSTAFCILYKLFTLKLTRKQVVGLINHSDSPYIRALGFMYIRYTQPPSDLWDWYENYLNDPEELDVKAGGGQMMSIGEMLRHFLSKLEWFSTLFPRIPVPIQKDLERKLSNWRARPENKALLESSSSRNGETEKQGTNEDWVDASSSHQKDYAEESRVKIDVSEEIAREKERQRKDRERHSSPSRSRHYSSDHHKSHTHQRNRSRSPRRYDSKVNRDEEVRRSKKKHHDRDYSSERSKHKSSKHKKESESSESRHYSKDRIHKHSRKHEHSHKHHETSSRHHEKHSRSYDSDRY